MSTTISNIDTDLRYGDCVFVIEDDAYGEYHALGHVVSCSKAHQDGWIGIRMLSGGIVVIESPYDRSGLRFKRVGAKSTAVESKRTSETIAWTPWWSGEPIYSRVGVKMIYRDR